MKKLYEKPLMEFNYFVVDEHIAVCSKLYTVECTRKYKDENNVEQECDAVYSGSTKPWISFSDGTAAWRDSVKHSDVIEAWDTFVDYYHYGTVVESNPS